MRRRSPSTWRPRSAPTRSSQEHSTIGLVITTDGSISDIPREEYDEAEERVIGELQEINKPFVVLLNCVEPSCAEAPRSWRADLRSANTACRCVRSTAWR